MRISDGSSDVCSSDLRKRDGTAPRDESTYPVFAAAGYAGVRVDMRGSGESEGVLDDEYSPRELADACAVIAWIAAQSWCSGAVGMMGISWGGFNSRSEEHTSELQSLMRTSYAVFCLKKKITIKRCNQILRYYLTR